MSLTCEYINSILTQLNAKHHPTKPLAIYIQTGWSACSESHGNDMEPLKVFIVGFGIYSTPVSNFLDASFRRDPSAE